MEVLSRNISARFAPMFLGWFSPSIPLRNTVTRSVRGKFVGALAAGNSDSISAGRTGFVT